jgi:hypothetical protein
MYGSLLAPFFLPSRGSAAGLSLGAGFVPAIAGQLFSPSRGLFVYCPFVLCSLAGAWIALRAPAHPLERLAGAVVAGHALLIAAYGDWFGGHSFGPRYFADVAPLLVFLLLPYLRWLRDQPAPLRRAGAAALFVVSLTSVWIHSRGATVWATYEWNTRPVDVGAAPARLWDWSDPQFLRGLPGHVVPASAPAPPPNPR